MDEFVEDIVFLLIVLGYTIIRSASHEATHHSPQLVIARDGLTASGRETDEGFIVYKDSQARHKTVPSVGKSGIQMRSILLDKGVMILDPASNQYLFAQDYVFSSPSLAAGVILGRSSNGRVEWKTKQGKTLKEIQEAQTETQAK